MHWWDHLPVWSIFFLRCINTTQWLQQFTCFIHTSGAAYLYSFSWLSYSPGRSWGWMALIPWWVILVVTKETLVLRKYPRKKNQIHQKFGFKRNTFDIPTERSEAQKILWVILHDGDPATPQKQMLRNWISLSVMQGAFYKAVNQWKSQSKKKKKAKKHKKPQLIGCLKSCQSELELPDL